MATKQGKNAGAPGPKIEEDREHFRGYLQAYRSFKEAMETDEYDEPLAAMASAVERIRAAMPDEARAVDAGFAAMNEMWDRATSALIDVCYHECERRALAPDLTRSKDKSKQAKARHAKDPKQAAKAGALELWKERHAGKHPKLRTVEQFAIEVMRRWPDELQSAKVICGWSAAWTKAVKEGKNPVC